MTIFQEILTRCVLLGNETRKPNMVIFDSGVITKLPWSPQTSCKSMQFLSMVCTKMYLTHDIFFFRKDKWAGMDLHSTFAQTMDRMKQTWQAIRWRDGQYQLSTLDIRLDESIAKFILKEDFWLPLGKVCAGHAIQERCRVIKEELMQRTWHPDVIAKRLAQGREDLLD